MVLALGEVTLAEKTSTHMLETMVSLNAEEAQEYLLSCSGIKCLYLSGDHNFIVKMGEGTLFRVLSWEKR